MTYVPGLAGMEAVFTANIIATRRMSVKAGSGNSLTFHILCATLITDGRRSGQTGGVLEMWIRSGEFEAATAIRDYRMERLGDVYVERVIWGPSAPRRLGEAVIGGDGWVCFRFWLLREGQVVERYYKPTGELAGTQVDVCMPPACDECGCEAADLGMALWITPDGRVTLDGEGRFEQAVRLGQVGPSEAAYAEQHLRSLTANIARGRFPPPIVRNWQIDPSRMQFRSEEEG